MWLRRFCIHTCVAALVLGGGLGVGHDGVFGVEGDLEDGREIVGGCGLGDGRCGVLGSEGDLGSGHQVVK